MWAKMEHFIHPVSLPSLVYAPLPLSKQHLTNNPIVNGSLQLWSQFRTHFKLRQALPSLPVVANALFSTSLMDVAFKIWFKNGLKQVKDLFKDGVFMYFKKSVSTSLLTFFFPGICKYVPLLGSISLLFHDSFQIHCLAKK